MCSRMFPEVWDISFAPPGLRHSSSVLPTADAVGCVLAPLRGWGSALSAVALDHLQHLVALRAVTDVTTAIFCGPPWHHFGNLTQFSNSPLQFFSFIWYKQSHREQKCGSRSYFVNLSCPPGI